MIFIFKKDNYNFAYELGERRSSVRYFKVNTERFWVREISRDEFVSFREMWVTEESWCDIGRFIKAVWEIENDDLG